MGYGDVKCTFQKGELNEMWRYIVSVDAEAAARLLTDNADNSTVPV